MDIVSFLLKSILMGAALAMDAFSVSVADGLNHPEMKRAQRMYVTGAFGLFQFLMPLTGWFLVNFAEKVFSGIVPYVPYIGFLILLILGVKMIVEGWRERKNPDDAEAKEGTIGFRLILLQAVATSIDALSVGFVTAGCSAPEAFLSSVIIGITTFIISLAGVHTGRAFGKKLSFAGQILGGIILIVIGIRLIPIF